MKKFLFLAFFFCFGLIKGQITFEKMHQLLGATGEGRSVSQTNDGGYITAGFCFIGSTQGVFLSKINSNGQLQWIKTFGIYTGSQSTQGYSIKQTLDGGYILAGSIYNAGPGSNDLLLLKVDTWGNLQWSKLYGSGNPDLGFDVIQTADAGYLLTGYNSVGSNEDIVLIKTDSIGNSMWRKTYGGPAIDHGQCLLQNSDGGYLIGGTTNGFGATYTDFFLIKTNSIGDTLWSRGYGSINIDVLRSLQPTYDGGFILTGDSGGAFYIVKTDSVGNIDWAKTFDGGFGPDYGWFGQQTNDGGYIFTGSKYLPLVGTINNMNVLLIKTDYNGDTLWTRSYGGPYVDEGYCVKQTSDGGYIVSGVRSLTTPSFTGSSQCAYMIKTDSLGNTSCPQSYGVVNVGSIFPITYASAPTIGVPVFAELTPPLVCNYFGGTETLYCFDRKDVWPGDADNNDIVDNYDLLPIGLYYSQIGFPRASISNVWQSDSSANWVGAQINGSNIKHADSNGDGIINDNDTLAIDLNYTLSHSFVPNVSEARSSVPDIYIVTASSTYMPGSWVDAEVWLGLSSSQVNNLYGIGFDIDYDLGIVQTGTETITYPSSFLGTVGTDAIKIGKVDPLASNVHCAISRINHTNSDGFGKIADFNFQISSSISSPTTMNFSISFKANDSIGAPKLFNPQPHSISIIPLGTNVPEATGIDGVSVYPNPYEGSTQIKYSLISKSYITLEVFNAIGQKVETLASEEQQAGEHKYSFSAVKKGYDAGVYFVKMTIDSKVIMKKLVEIK